MRTNTHNANGDVSKYGLSLGIIQTYEKNNIRVRLWQEHGAYHVRCHNFNTGNRIEWKVFPIGELTHARLGFAIERLRIRLGHYKPYDSTLGTHYNGS
jgi:hypothetical protein